MKKTILVLLSSLFVLINFAQVSKAKFNKFWAVNANIDISKNSSLGIGASLVLDDTSGYYGWNKDNSHAPPAFSTWIISYKHNFWLQQLDNNVVKAHQLALEWHNWDLGKATIFGDIPKSFKLNYFNVYSDGDAESVIAPEVGLSLVYFQLSYRHNFFLTSNSKYENFIGSSVFTINFLLPFTKNTLRKD
jgi:hypothetical protein